MWSRGARERATPAMTISTVPPKIGRAIGLVWIVAVVVGLLFAFARDLGF